MKAVVQRRYGGPGDLELREVRRPEPGEGEVLVRVRAASLHPDVWHVVAGRPWILRLMGAGLLRPDPSIPGTDMAGVVEAVGEGVTRFQVDDAVFGETTRGNQWVHGGAFAEYVTPRAEWLAAKPDGVSFEEAASVPTSGFIVLLNLRDPERPGPGNRVLVNGAGGGVGSIALQLAKARGARVTAVDTGAKRELLLRLGADETLDFTREDFTRLDRRWDLVFDVPGDRPFREIRRALEPDGKYVPIGHDHYGAAGRRAFGLIPHFLGLMARGRFTSQLRGSGLPPPTRGEAMATLAELLDEGRLTPVLDSVWKLEETPAALRHMVEDELLGKVVIRVG